MVREKSERSDIYTQWLVAGMNNPEKTRLGLAAALGISPSEVTKLMKGGAKGGREIKAFQLAAISRYIEVPIPIPPSSYRIRGNAKRPATSCTITHEIDENPTPLKNGFDAIAEMDDPFPMLPRSAVKVRTNAVDQKFPFGSYAVYVNYIDARPEGIVSGDFIFGRLKHNGGGIGTYVIRRIEKQTYGFMLLCASTNMKRNAEVIHLNRKLQTEHGDELEIIGLIVRAVMIPESADS